MVLDFPHTRFGSNHSTIGVFEYSRTRVPKASNESCDFVCELRFNRYLSFPHTAHSEVATIVKVKATLFAIKRESETC